MNMKIFNEIGNIFNIHGEQSGEIKIRNNAPQEIKEVETKSKSVFDSLPQELRQALERAFGQDVILDRKTMEIVLSYLEKYPGTIEEKLK